MQYLIINRYGVFVTRVSPRRIRQHIYSLVGQSGTLLNLSSQNSLKQLLYRDQVADILEKDFVPRTQGIERQKQSLQTDATTTNASLICSQILYMLDDAVPYDLITSNIPCTLVGLHMTDQTLSPKWRVGVNVTSTFVNIGCAVWEYKITQCCNSIIEELDRERNDYHWIRTAFEQQLYEWAFAKRNTLQNAFTKAGAGVMRNTIDIVGDSIDIARGKDYAKW